MERGFDAHRKGDLEGALQDYNQAIRLKPNFADAFVCRGIVRRRDEDEANGDLEGALRDLTEALRLKPDHAGAFYNRGLSRLFKGDLEGALRDWKQGRAQPDQPTRAYLELIAVLG